MTQHQDWHPIALEAVKLGFDHNRISIDQDRVHKAIDLFSSIMNNSEIDVPWPYLKYAELLDDNAIEEKIKLYKKAYDVEPNVYSCLGLIAIYHFMHVDLIEARKWFKFLFNIDGHNAYVDYCFNLIKPQKFNSKLYLSHNPHLHELETDENITIKDFVEGKRKMSLIQHYVLQANGQNFQYELPENFNPKEYKKLNIDLSHFNDDELIRHYIEFGIKESRNHLSSYTTWKQQNFPNIERINEIRLILKSLAYAETKNILFSIIMPVYNTTSNFLTEALDSVLNQVYDNWELCIADDGSTEPHVKEILESYKRKDGRIKIIYNKTNKHICHASNLALSLATGEFVVFMDSDDLLSIDALYEMFMLLNFQQEVDMIYSDEDKINFDGDFVDPFFKPEWSPDTLLSKMYTCHLSAYRRSIVSELGGLREGFEGSQDWDLMLRFSEKTQKIAHIPKMLYHWRMHPNSTSMSCDAKPYAHIASKKALDEALVRRGEVGEAVSSSPGMYNIRYVIKEYKKVSIIISNKDFANLLDKCLISIFSKTIYPNYEVLVIDNHSVENNTYKIFEKWKTKEPQRFKVLKSKDKKFNYSSMNNQAAQNCNGYYFLFLNNDTEVINQDWLNAMVEQAQRPSIGAVGSLLFYPDNTIQHAGVIVGLWGAAGHRFSRLPSDHPGCFGNAQYQNNVSAVTGACLMCRRDVFDQVGGFEEQLEVALNDIDLCLKILDSGYNNIYVPTAKLYHHESITRGHENTPEKIKRFEKEVSFFRERWQKYIDNDPYYSPNLTRVHSDYRVLEKKNEPGKYFSQPETSSSFNYCFLFRQEPDTVL
jgi:GT2 family glycosyltransferase